jgi:hypothetical protein
MHIINNGTKEKKLRAATKEEWTCPLAEDFT